jgi:hypothetical protein
MIQVLPQEQFEKIVKENKRKIYIKITARYFLCLKESLTLLRRFLRYVRESRQLIMLIDLLCLFYNKELLVE